MVLGNLTLFPPFVLLGVLVVSGGGALLFGLWRIGSAA